MPRNTWKTNCRKPQCQACVNSWKQKAQRHGYNAQALKFVLMSMAEAPIENHITNTPTGQIGALPNEEQMGQAQGKLKSQCGICKENYTVRGANNMCAFTCSHTCCLECVRAMKAAGTAGCPYCRAPIKKVIVLHYDADEETEQAAPAPVEDDDDEVIVVPKRKTGRQEHKNK